MFFLKGIFNENIQTECWYIFSQRFSQYLNIIREKLQWRLSWQCKLDSLCVARQSLCKKFQLICGFFHPADPTFRMFGLCVQLNVRLLFNNSLFAKRCLQYVHFKALSKGGNVFSSFSVQFDSRLQKQATLSEKKFLFLKIDTRHSTKPEFFLKTSFYKRDGGLSPIS